VLSHFASADEEDKQESLDQLVLFKEMFYKILDF